ncbi:MAG: hypothetical protein AAF664_26370 [Planctomycetota bacterium]
MMQHAAIQRPLLLELSWEFWQELIDVADSTKRSDLAVRNRDLLDHSLPSSL